MPVGESGAGELDPIIHQPTRLKIMAALHRNRQASFTGLRDGLGLTDGNLATHAGKLAEAGYLDSRRVLNDALSFEVRYRITEKGSEAFQRYVTTLQAFLAESLEAPAPGGAEVPAADGRQVGA